MYRVLLLAKKGVFYMTSKHFTIDDRVSILYGVSNNLSIRSIASSVNASPSTVSRELEKHRILDEPSSYRNKLPDCPRTSKAPWVCNGCDNFKHCRKLKFRYIPSRAQKDYEDTLHDSRKKVRTGSEGLKHIDHIVTPLIRDNGQSVSHVFHTHSKILGISRSTLYRYIDDNRLTVRNIDLPARVRYPKHSNKKRGDNSSIDNQKCRENRDYAAFQGYISNHPNASIAEMDSVEGVKGKGHKVLLTILLRNSNFMIAILRDENTSNSTIEALNYIQDKIGFAAFTTMFNIVLTDNGSEFKDVDRIENTDTHTTKRCNVFYCDSRCSQQKGRIEKNHEYIRKFVPQGKSFDHLTQKDINRMMSHINSVKRDSLNGKSPFECLNKKYLNAMKKLDLHPLSPDEVILKPSIF